MLRKLSAVECSLLYKISLVIPRHALVRSVRSRELEATTKERDELKVLATKYEKLLKLTDDEKNFLQSVDRSVPQ